MTEQHYHRPSFKLLTPGNGILMAIMAIGLMAAGYRFIQGLGAATNLSDQFPWGLWIAFDVVCGVALAAGGFTTAAVVYIFWGEKYHGLVRPAVLTGFLGYVFVAVGLLADLGLPWNIWHPIIYWPKHSALFEVAWCVMLYASVLALEFLPAVFDRFNWQWAHNLFAKLVPLFVVAALTFFTYIMSHSLAWTAIAFVVLALLAVFLPKLVRGERGAPILLIFAGILFSTAHQSSLGTLFLLTPDKLHHLWWTPMLPVNFYLTAVAVGFAMVMFEATVSAKSYGMPVEDDALRGLSRILGYVLLIYLVVRMVDIAVLGNLPLMLSSMGLLFAAEMLLVVFVPMVMLFSKRFYTHVWFRFTAASLVIFGLIFNRFNVTLNAMNRPGEGFYFPGVIEIVITMAIVAAIFFFYNIAVKMFPVLPEHDLAPAGANPATHGEGGAQHDAS
jgi:formate dehydrogenase iron-sulfur subunit